MKNIQRLIALLFLSTGLFAQNLVPNPSFELKSNCPPAQNYLHYASDWSGLGNHTGTPDYFHSCAGASEVLIPNNSMGIESANSGEAYAGISMYSAASNYREYIQVELIETLEAGLIYQVSLNYSLAEESKWAVNALGFYFSQEEVTGNGTYAPLDVMPQVLISDFLDRTEGWEKVAVEFTATGTEKFLVIGSFAENVEINPVLVNSRGSQESYVFLDDISVIESPCNYEIDFGPDATVCREAAYMLDATVDGATYEWQDGSTEPIMEVKKEGIYSVIVRKDECLKTDEIEIKFFEQPDLKLSGDTVLCEDDRVELEFGGLEVDFACNNICTEDGKIIEVDGRYFVSVEYSCGNYKEAVDVSFIDCSCQLFLPNTFTPNLDNLNSEFKPITYCDLQSYVMYIYNRWGELVFESHSIENAWIGRDGNNELPDGKYEYLVKYQFVDMEFPKEEYGSVYLKR